MALPSFARAQPKRPGQLRCTLVGLLAKGCTPNRAPALAPPNRHALGSARRSPLPAATILFHLSPITPGTRLKFSLRPRPLAASLLPPPRPPWCATSPTGAVLGRFLHSLNQFCAEAYGMRYEVGDYWAYDFAKVGL